MDRAILRAACSNPNVQAFARVVREGESGQTEIAYRMRYGGAGQKPKWFDDFSRHPKVFERTPDGLMSSAAGAYQFTWTTWIETASRWGITDFSPQSQDEAFVARLIYRDALEDVKAGRFEEACRKCATEWTSLPGGLEPNAATKRARETWDRWREILAASQPDPLATEHYGETVTESTITPIPSAVQQEEHNMAAPLIPIAIAAAQAFLPRLIELIPTLGAAFGSGSEVQKRNVAAAAMVAEAVTKAVGEPNLQSAIETMQRNPEKLAEARAAVGDILPTLVEVGGGVAAARKASEPFQTAEWWRFLAVPQTWFGLLLLGLVYLAMGNVTGLFGFQGWTPELRSNVVFAIVGVAIGSVSGYYFGTSSGSARKTDLLANPSRE